MQPIPENSHQATRKNLIREKIRNYFKLRDCQILIRPLAEEDKLNQIENQPWDSLKSMFRYNYI